MKEVEAGIQGDGKLNKVNGACFFVVTEKTEWADEAG